MRWLCGLALIIFVFGPLSPHLTAATPTSTPSSEKNQQRGQRSSDIQRDKPLSTAATDQQTAGDVKQKETHEYTPIAIAPVTVTKSAADYLLIIFTIVFTGGLVFVGALQVRWLKRQTRISRLGIKTNRLAVEIAQTALRADRPFLLIESPKLLYFEPVSKIRADTLPISIKFIFRNCGKNPAIISKVLCRLAVVKTLRPISTDAGIEADDFPRFGHYERCKWVDIRENVIAADEKSTPYSVELETTRSDVEKGKLSDATFDLLTKHALLLVVHGVVRYSDILQRRHETEFIGIYNPPDSDAVNGRFQFEFADRPQRENEGS